MRSSVPDETSRISKQRPPQSAQEQLRQITQDVIGLSDMLKVQRATLRPRAIGLPLGSQETVKEVQKRLEGLAGQLLSRQIELRQLRALAETTALLNSSLDTDSVLNQVMDTVIQLTGAERGYIMLRNRQNGELEFRIARGLDREPLTRDDVFVSNTVVNQVFETGESVMAENARLDPRFKEKESIVNYQMRSILCVPLIVRGETIGVVYCDNRALSGLFKDHEKNLLHAFANQAAVAIENAQLFEAAQAQLAEISELRDLMDNIFTSIASGLIILDSNNTITMSNPTAEAIVGMSEQQMLGAPLYDVLPGLAGVFQDKLVSVREAGKTETVEAEVILDGTEHRIWNVVMSPLRGMEHSLGTVLVLDDLTEQREREAQFEQAADYLPLAVVENLRSEDLTALGGQEREITVLFADVRGFTSFAEDLPPEHLMEIINKYMTIASDSINLYEGVVDKYMGDAATGLFNTQLNQQEDHALRAVRAAMSMVYDVQALHEVLPPEQRLFYGVGIHTGSAVLGNVGSMNRREFSAIGDAVEMSKLLQENAQKGEIIVSAYTYEQVKDHFEFEAMTPHKTKGLADFTVMYKVKGYRKRGTGPLG
jgi:PAS domain S-box-containing protein